MMGRRTVTTLNPRPANHSSQVASGVRHPGEHRNAKEPEQELEISHPASSTSGETTRSSVRPVSPSRLCACAHSERRASYRPRASHPR
jgi:hypothetical protein